MSLQTDAITTQKQSLTKYAVILADIISHQMMHTIFFIFQFWLNHRILGFRAIL